MAAEAGGNGVDERLMDMAELMPCHGSGPCGPTIPRTCSVGTYRTVTADVEKLPLQSCSCTIWYRSLWMLLVSMQFQYLGDIANS
jgi:hypothetical protein